MAKKKEDGDEPKKTKKSAEPTGPVGRLAALQAAREANQRAVGAGADPFMDPLRLNVRGLPLPSIALQYMLGYTAIEASTCLVIDGPPMSGKSSLAAEIYNWGIPFGVSGVHVDGENKDAWDILQGTLDPILGWAGLIKLEKAATIEEAQEAMYKSLDRAHEVNDSRDLEDKMLSIDILDPMSGTPSEEHLESVEEEGSNDRGHGGRDEALLWTKFFKTYNSKLIGLPTFGIFVNHVKEKTEKQGKRDVKVEYNPGGVGQNYAATVHFGVKAFGRPTEYENGIRTVSKVGIFCKKNSRGPTYRSVTVDKTTYNREDGTTSFTWDWGVATARFLADRAATCPTKKMFAVIMHSEQKFSCKKLGFENTHPSEIGNYINNNVEIMEELADVLRIRRIKPFTRMLDTELLAWRQQSYADRRAYYERGGIAVPEYVVAEELALQQLAANAQS